MSMPKKPTDSSPPDPMQMPRSVTKLCWKWPLSLTTRCSVVLSASERKRRQNRAPSGNAETAEPSYLAEISVHELGFDRIRIPAYGSRGSLY
jgi:hypothetical protein